MAYRTYAPCNGFLVSKDGTGDFTTIQAAVTAATSGTTIYINDGVYTENITLTQKTHLVSLSSQVGYAAGGLAQGNVRIIGKVQDLGPGFVSAQFQGIGFYTNNDYAIYQTNSTYDFFNCNFIFSNHDGILGHGNLTFRSCTGATTEPGFAFLTVSISPVWMYDCTFINFGNSIKNSVWSNNSYLRAYNTILEFTLEFDDSSFIDGNNLIINTTDINQECIITNNGLELNYCTLQSGTSYALYNTGTIDLASCIIESNSAFEAIVNAGGFMNINELIFTGTQTNINNTGIITGGPVTIGQLTLLDPLSPSNGGTGLISPGTAGNVLTSDGTNWTSKPAGEQLPITDIAVNTLAVVNNSYAATAAVTLTLPASPAQSDTVQVMVATGGSMIIQANTGQLIMVGVNASTTAGTATNTQIGDSLTLRYRTSNSTWRAYSSEGTWSMS